MPIGELVGGQVTILPCGPHPYALMKVWAGSPGNLAVTGGAEKALAGGQGELGLGFSISG